MSVIEELRGNDTALVFDRRRMMKKDHDRCHRRGETLCPHNLSYWLSPACCRPSISVSGGRTCIGGTERGTSVRRSHMQRNHWRREELYNDRVCDFCEVQSYNSWVTAELEVACIQYQAV
jgi:hypothetical protein